MTCSNVSSMNRGEEIELSGAAVSPGIGIGTAFAVERGRLVLPRRSLEASEVDAEVVRFETALERVRKSFEGLRETLSEIPSQDPLLILQTHLEMLDDPQIRSETIGTIRRERINAERALDRVCQKIRGVFDAIEDEYIKSRAEDIGHLCERITEELMGEEHAAEPVIGPDTVVVTRELAPDDAIHYAQIPVAGFVCQGGSLVSHAAIIARTFGIPTVMGVPGINQQLGGGEILVVDGNSGTVAVDPGPETLERARRRREARLRKRQQVLSEVHRPTVTPDGGRVRLMANIELPEEVPLLERFGADGVGLYRTEYLFLNRREPPSVEEMAEHYRRVLEGAGERSVTFRTIDVGGDKLPDSISMSVGDNPAMGLRGIRYSLSRPELFRAQIRAILQADEHGRGRVLLPLISGHEELRSARELIESVARDEGRPVPEIGVMIETPSSVMTADILIRNADFLSIGTNDLIQYALAIDRTDETVAYLYAPLHLGILRMLRNVAEVAKAAGTEVGVCGEMAGDPMFTLVLLGLDIQTLSMAPTAIPLIRTIVRRTPKTDAHRIVQGIFALKNPDEIQRVLEHEVRERFGDLVRDEA